MTISSIEEVALPLPACRYRESTEIPDLYFCQHTKVHVQDGLVNAAVCQLCKVRETECRSPRDRLKNQSAQTVAHQQVLRAPPLAQQGWNLAHSLKAFVADGFKTVTAEQYAARLKICDACEQRRGTRCMKCGCGLSWKARGRAFQCPLGKWPTLCQSPVNT